MNLPPRLWVASAFALGGLALALAALAGPGSASLTPPPTGDWTVLVGENALLSGGSTVVTGNVTVQGSLVVANATLELDAPAAGVVPRLFVQGPSAFLLDNSTLRAGPGPSARMLLDASSGAALTLRTALVQGLGNATQGVLSMVGARLVGATVRVWDSTINASDGGIGLDQGATLDARNLTVEVHLRAIYLVGNSTATAVGVHVFGDFLGSDFLVLADHGVLSVSDSTLANATTVLLLLSSTGTFANTTMERASHGVVLLVGSTLDFDGGRIAPRSDFSVGVEAYGSTARLRAVFQNYTYGIAALGSVIEVKQSSFASSNETPKSSFAAIYAFDSTIRVSNATFNGSYLLTTSFTCSNSAMWVVRSTVFLSDADTFCFSDHYHAEDSDSHISSLSLRDGNIGLTIFHGTIDAWNITAVNFSRGGGATAIEFSEAAGTVRNLSGSQNSVVAELRTSSVTLDGFSTTSPGLGVLVISGAPVITNSNFTVHNGTGIWVQGGTPVILNSTYWLSADRIETEGVNVTGGAPVVSGNTFHGTLLLTAGVRVWGGAARVESNTFITLERGAVFYSQGFVAEGNRVVDCRNGIEARLGASGTIRGNTFENLTEVGFGTGINVYMAAALIEGNTFRNVNYGLKFFNYSSSDPDGARVAGNSFEDVGLYAIEVFGVSRALLVDNNTVRNASRGGIEELFSEVVSAYNVIYDAQAYGYELTESNLTLVGGRLENLSEGIHANLSNITVRYTTFILNNMGMIVQDGTARIENSSFQFNGIAAEFVSDLPIEIIDSIFVGNVEGVLAFHTADVLIRDSNFVGTLDYILNNADASTGRIEFTRRGELNGGRFLLRGQFDSTADGLSLKALKMLFALPPGGLPGVSIRGASELQVSSVSLANSSVPFTFEIEDSEGSLTQVQIRGAVATASRPGLGPYFGNSTLTLRDVQVNDTAQNFTVVGSSLTATNLTLRDSRAGAGVVLEGSSLSGSAIAVLDNALCGIVGSGGAALNATNLTVRGNLNGSLCLDASRAQVFDGDFSSGGLDIDLTNGSVVAVVSTSISRGWRVADTSLLTISWYIQVHVTYPNPALLPTVVVSIIDAKGLAYLAAPSVSGAVEGLPPFPERLITSGGADVRTPYTVAASKPNATATANVVLTQDRLVQLDLADRTAPVVVIESPQDGAGFAGTSVTFRFRASDSGSGIESLQYRFGAGAFNAIAPSPGPIEITRDLVDGDHQFVVRAVDFAGNALEAAVNFTVDTRAPLISLVSPRFPANLTRLARITVQVTVESDVAALTIGGVAVNFSGGAGSRAVDLPEGDFQVEVVATDRVGNRANITVFVASDRTAPELVVEYPGNSTAESFIIVRGRAEQGSQVQVAGQAVPLSNGTFELLVLLNEGRNDIEIRARDSLQNENVSHLTITRGVLQPSHVLDIVAELLGAGLLVAAAALFYVFYRRASPKQPAPPPGGELR
jgi:hypothetical protein